MSKKSLIIVESPTKIKTLKQILGSDYIFESSYGHIRDLPANDFGIDIDHDFEPTYVPMKEKNEVIKRLQNAAKQCDVIYLCPDPDREGEAIAWHISQLIDDGTDKKEIKRVTFHSITKDAVKDALTSPRSLNLALVNAQQARRLLDRIVGYSISPLLNRRLRRGRNEPVSAGRVQSVALKLVVDREKAIEVFVPQEYWNIQAQLTAVYDSTHMLERESSASFTALLHAIQGKRLEKEISKGKEKSTTAISNEKDALKIVEELQTLPFTIQSIDRKDKKRQPEAPFTTSTLQQEASRHFRFSPSRTMEIAQDLYEGIELGGRGIAGLITYMRTDSVRVAPEAIQDVRNYIIHTFGQENLNPITRSFQVKKSAQDAHEAIRPADVFLDPETVRPYLSREQTLLYTLIWKRYVASQMANAIYNTLTYDIAAGKNYLFRATGSRLKFLGFLAVYEEKKDEEDEEHHFPQKQNDEVTPNKKSDVDQFKAILPEVTIGQTLKKEKIHPVQSFTRPPAFFNEATLVKELEKSGIGRPSTYASIMKKISAREYTTKEQGRLKPTELGRIVTDMLESHFQNIMNVGFTASMEDFLEEVAENKLDWKQLLKDFWSTFSASLVEAKEHLIPPKIMTDIFCPKCGSALQKIWFKSKYFLGCSKYPDCDFSSSLEEMSFDKSQYAENFDWDQVCAKCHSSMKIRFGKFGAFLGCSKYPECRNIVTIPKKGEEATLGIESNTTISSPCPAEGCDGILVQRRSRFGKLFWSCSTFPDCDVIGDSIDSIQSKFSKRVKTAYQKASGKKKKTVATAATTKKKSAKAKKSTAAQNVESIDAVPAISPRTSAGKTKKKKEDSPVKKSMKKSASSSTNKREKIRVKASLSTTTTSIPLLSE